MDEEHLAKVNSNSKSKEKIQLSKWREQACFWRQNSNYHRKWREQACFSMFSRWRQISNSNRMRNICRNGARSEADLAQCGALALPPPFLFLWLLRVGAIFFQRPLHQQTTQEAKRKMLPRTWSTKVVWVDARLMASAAMMTRSAPASQLIWRSTCTTRHEHSFWARASRIRYGHIQTKLTFICGFSLNPPPPPPPASLFLSLSLAVSFSSWIQWRWQEWVEVVFFPLASHNLVFWWKKLHPSRWSWMFMMSNAGSVPSSTLCRSHTQQRHSLSPLVAASCN